MFLGLFKKKVKMVTVKRKEKAKKAKVNNLKVRRKITKAKRKPKIMPKVVGKVTHYFPHVKAGVILVSRGTISLGDTLQIKGHTTDFKQKVVSMQINNASIKKAKAKDEVGLSVKSRVRHNDTVYKV